MLREKSHGICKHVAAVRAVRQMAFYLGASRVREDALGELGQPFGTRMLADAVRGTATV
jgi:hypothetical protein